MAKKNSYKQQLDQANKFLIVIASTGGKLDQSILAWKKALENCTNMMEETEGAVKTALIEPYKAITTTSEKLKNTDGKVVNSMIKQLGIHAKKVIDTNKTWRNNYEKGKNEAKSKVSSNVQSGQHNSFDAQVEMISSIVDTIDGITAYTRITKSIYGRYEFDLRQENFMIQYCNTLTTNCFTPRKQNFQQIETTLVTSRAELMKIYNAIINSGV